MGLVRSGNKACSPTSILTMLFLGRRSKTGTSWYNKGRIVSRYFPNIWEHKSIFRDTSYTSFFTKRISVSCTKGDSEAFWGRGEEIDRSDGFLGNTSRVYKIRNMNEKLIHKEHICMCPKYGNSTLLGGESSPIVFVFLTVFSFLA